MTELFCWSDDFSVGIDEIDEQHKELVSLLNQLHGAIRDQHGSTVARKILDQLADYTRRHFAVEESLMRIANYPDFAVHKHGHEDLIGQVNALQAGLDDGSTTLSTELLHFLKAWLTRHIGEADKRLGFFLLDSRMARHWSPHVREAMSNRKGWWQFW